MVASCFDLSKAFDTVFHSILVVKLRRHGLNRWTKNSLDHEVQRVVVNNSKSNCQLVRHSIPQWSVLVNTFIRFGY